MIGSAVLTAVIAAGSAEGAERVDLPVRGRTIEISIYTPKDVSSAKGTIIMGGGDAGWVGLAVSLSEFLSGEGYIVAGLNVRQYLSTFTQKKTHLMPEEAPGDYAELAAYLRRRGLLKPLVVVSGVSEGAALAVLAASAPSNHAWMSGVITMGLPAVAELAWRWTDITTLITKKDANEPSFAPKDFIADVSPLPLFMIQSTKDEYVPEADYREFERTARAPKSLTLINASNHRFTDKMPELRGAFLAGIEWVRAR